MPTGPDGVSPELESNQEEWELTKGQQLGRELEEIAAGSNNEKPNRLARIREAGSRLVHAGWGNEGNEPETEDIEPYEPDEAGESGPDENEASEPSFTDAEIDDEGDEDEGTEGNEA